tara:strand:- start:46 stop:903 length:858 start_codon:yes stop_codon:yes gene_type:complete
MVRTTRNWLKRAHDYLDNPLTIGQFEHEMNVEFQRGGSSAKDNPWTKPYMYVVTGHPRVLDGGRDYATQETQEGYLTRLKETTAEYEARLKGSHLLYDAKGRSKGAVPWKVGVAHGKVAQPTARLGAYKMSWGHSQAKIGWFQIQPNAHSKGKMSVVLHKEKLLKTELKAFRWQGKEWFVCTAKQMRTALANMQRKFESTSEDRPGFDGQVTRFSPRIRLMEDQIFVYAERMLAARGQIQCKAAPKGTKGETTAQIRKRCRVVFPKLAPGEARQYVLEQRGQELQ